MNERPACRRSRRRNSLATLVTVMLLGPTAGGAELLVPGQILDRELAATEQHMYRVRPGAGGVVLIAEQRGIDVEIEVGTADGGFVIDSPFDRRGRETVLLAGSADYRITVRGREVGAPPGRYALRLSPLPAATRESERRLEAVRAATAAGRLYRRSTPAAWRVAVAQYRGAFRAWSTLDETEEAAWALYAVAVLHRLLDAPRDGLEAAGGVLELLERFDDPFLEAYAWNELGLDHWHLGEAAAAARAFECSSARGTLAGDAYIVAAAAANLCLLELSRGEILAGRACYDRSLPAIVDAGAPTIESAVRTNLGRLAEHLGEPDEALAHYRRALELLELADDRAGRGRTLNNLGVLLRGRGELDAAMASYADALEIFEELEDQRWQARILNNIGYAYLSVDDARRALVSFERALVLFRQVEDRRGEASTLDFLALAKRRLGRGGEAPELHLRVLELRRRDGDRHGEAVTLRRLAELYATLGDTETAWRYLGEAVTIAAEIGDRLNEAVARQKRAEIRLERGALEAARGELATALELARGAGQRAREAEILLVSARREQKAGHGNAARRELAAALDQLESLRSGIISPALRTSYSSLLRRAYELDVELRMAAHRADPAAGHDRRALEAAERARARALVELLQEADVDLTAGADPRLLEHRRGLARRLHAKTERLADPELDAASRKALQAEHVTLFQRLEVAETELRRASPAYGEIVRPPALEAGEIQALADAETTLAVYSLGETSSFLFRVTPEKIDVFELTGRSAIEAAARRVHRRWSELDVAARAEDHAAATELAALVRLPELLGRRRLAIVADGALHLVPFAALPVDGGPDGPPVPLVHRLEVVSLPGTSFLALDRGRPATSKQRTVAILADPLLGPEHPPLPAGRREAEAIAARAGPLATLTAFGAQASRELVLSERLRGFEVVHFATHGLIDTANPASTGLLLAQVDSQGRPQPGFLALDDVFRLRLDAELVVLSGCRTALGPLVRGEGLIGLARGFMHAGARRVMASLWQVGDRATEALMTRFYRALWQDSLPPAAALATAQRELSQTRRYRDPFYWAGFVLVGDWH